MPLARWLSGTRSKSSSPRALVNQPALILADEPTGAVDTQTAQGLIGLLKELNRQQEVTVIIVTHDLDLAAQTDRVIRLKDGRVSPNEPAVSDAS